ncbi:MAG TPA: hypothetical protein VLH37_03430 [Bacteroidales bacterium]|nr:hypothetical protein [Bacteroidales bacterium]
MNKGKKPNLFFGLIDASVGTSTRYTLNFAGHLAIGILYSIELLPFHWIGLLLGVVLPGIWVFCSYRLLKIAFIPNIQPSVPAWIKKEPGNSLIILFDIAFLMVIWILIAGGGIDKTWVRILFAIVLPLAVLSLLRGLVKSAANAGNDEN